MTAPMLPRKSNRLAKLVFQPGGATMEEAVRAADANLDAIRGQLVTEVAASVERMQAIGVALQAGPDGHALEALYTLANSAIGVAGTAGLPALGQVCYSLCELIDRLQTTQSWSGAAVQVHMDSLRLLRPGTTEPEAQQKAIIAALRQVVGRV